MLIITNIAAQVIKKQEQFDKSKNEKKVFSLEERVQEINQQFRGGNYFNAPNNNLDEVTES